jgi:hypothetical protein
MIRFSAESPMSSERTIALETLNLLRSAKPTIDDVHLKAASIIAFPLGPITKVQTTPRFWASFATETLIRSICYREEAWLIAGRHAHAIAVATTWLESES